MAKTSKNSKNSDSRELLEALTILEKEKNISKDTMMDAIENSLRKKKISAKRHFWRRQSRIRY